MSAKDQAIKNAMTTIEKALSETLGLTLPKVMSELFDAGGIEYATALQKAMQSVGSMNDPVRSIVGGAMLTSNTLNTTGEQGKDGRAPRGAVRRAVLSALLPHPAGLTASEIVSQAQEIDPSISAGGIHNELNRKKGTIYINEGGLWRTPPELTLGGDFYDLNSLRDTQKGGSKVESTK